MGAPSFFLPFSLLHGRICGCLPEFNFSALNFMKFKVMYC